MICDIDELVLALAMTRSARDHLARQLPNNHVQDTPEQMALFRRLNEVFYHLSRAALEMREGLDAYTAPMTVVIVPERMS